jgi:hypothetical protein
MKCLQVIPISLLTLPFAHAEEPRIHVVSSAPFYMGVEDADGDGLKDLFSGWDRDIVHPTPTLSKNLGNRTFSPYSTPFLPFRSQDRWDGTAWIIEIQPGDRRLFLNHGTHIGDNVYEQTPQTIPLDGNGSGERTAIGQTSLQCWLPLDLDADQMTEFVSFTATGPTTGTLSIMDRQTDGSYSATTLPLADISWSDTEAKPLLADFDNDGDTDLMVFDHEARCHVVYLRSGHRSFAEAPAAIVGGDESINLKPADLDGDGLLDLYSYGGKTLVHYLGQPGLTFGPRQVKDPFASTSTPWTGIHVASNPGAPATLHFTHSSGTTVHWASVQFGTTTVLSEHSTDVSSLRPFTFGDLQPPDVHASEDLDLDGHPDLLISMYVSPGYPTQAVTRHAVAWGRADGFDTPVFVDPVPVRSDILLIGNFDEQSAPDLILGPDPDGYLWFYENSGTGDFPRRVRLDSLGRLHGSVTTISSIRAAEMDGDGILDVVVEYKQQVNFSYNYAHTIAKGRGDGTFHAPVLPEGSFTILSEEAHGLESLSDWDSDGDLDIISGGFWRENTGSAFSTEVRPLISGAALENILGNPMLNIHTRTGDVDGDGHPDVISLVYETETVISDIPSDIVGGPFYITKSTFAVGFNDGQGGIAEIAEVPVTLLSTDLLGNPVIHDLQVADLNADGRPDICFNEYVASDILGNLVTSSRWLKNPGGAAARNPAAWLKLPLGAPLPDSLHPQNDFDGDGIKDWEHATGYIRPSPAGPIVSASYDFARGIMFPSYDPAKTPADFDGDGDTDILYHRAADVWVVKNTIIDEREEITRYLVAAGVPGQSARPHADADGDGRDNLTELLMGENPLAPESPGANPLAVALETGNEGYHLSFRTPSYAADLGLNYTVEHSTNLTNWQELEGTTPVSASSINGWNFQTLSLPITGPSGYYRLRGHKAPR